MVVAEAVHAAMPLHHAAMSVHHAAPMVDETAGLTAVLEAHALHVAEHDHNLHAMGIGSQTLGPHDFIGATFYLACNMMLAFAIFFFMEVRQVPARWATSITVSGMVCFVAWYNYTYMKSAWQMNQASPTVFRYTDWLVTVPLLILEFFFILKACGPVDSRVGMNLLIGSIVMLIGGWLGESGILDVVSGFVISMAGYCYVLYEINCGEPAAIARNTTSKAGAKAFSTACFIVTYGWTIYPLGYMVAFLLPGGNSYFTSEICRNAIYNLADLLNKGTFGLVIWQAAKSEGEGMSAPLRR